MIKLYFRNQNYLMKFEKLQGNNYILPVAEFLSNGRGESNYLYTDRSKSLQLICSKFLHDINLIP